MVWASWGEVGHTLPCKEGGCGGSGGDARELIPWRQKIKIKTKKQRQQQQKCLSAHQNKAQELQNRGCLFVTQLHCGLRGHFRVSKMPEKSREHFKQLNTYSRPRLRRRTTTISVRGLHECYAECISAMHMQFSSKSNWYSKF